MNWLSRALTPGTGGRFALTDEPDSAKWQLLEIEPIGYESMQGDHGVLAKGVRHLADYSRRGLLDWQRDIAEIALPEHQRRSRGRRNCPPPPLGGTLAAPGRYSRCPRRACAIGP